MFILYENNDVIVFVSMNQTTQMLSLSFNINLIKIIFCEKTEEICRF